MTTQSPVMPPPLHVTEDSVDPRFNTPTIEVNELRTDPVPHRYVHGSFKGTEAKFSFYFPPKETYRGRFFQNTYPMAMTSDIAPFPLQFDVAVGDLGFTLDSGATYVQTNNGGVGIGGDPDPTVVGYRVNAAAAKYARTVAAELYGAHRPYGYLFGGSGGSYQVMGAAENTTGVWDGFLPYVMGTPYSIPSMFTVRLHALRVLRQRNKLPGILDAINPGGSGDPYAGLNDEERAALREATLLGYPLRGWWNHETLNSGYLAYPVQMVRMADPSYADDFWNKPGYLGADPNSSVRAARVQFETTIARVIDGPPKQIEFTAVPDTDFADADMHILSGAGAGKTVPLAATSGNPMGLGLAADPTMIAGLKAGDRVRLDNSWPLALQTYQRHQLPTPDMYGWNQFRGADGKPTYPQREAQVGLIGAINCAGSIPNGKVTGKTLALEVLADIDALPWQADWYRARATEHLGAKFNDTFAIWFIDNAQHDNPLTPAARANMISYAGALQQGLRDLAAWAEKGVHPLDSKYKVVDSQVEVPATAAERGGIQPVIDLKANGGARAEVKVGEAVTFTAAIEVPPKAGKVVSAEWDFEGVGTYPVKDKIATPDTVVKLTQTFKFARPGTYFPVLRVAAHRDGNAQTPYGRIQNLGRVRVVVS